MGLFGGHSEAQHPHFDLIAQSLQSHLGLQLNPPADDVLAILDQMAQRELNNFGILHSVEGMQELFRVRSIRAVVEHETQTVTLSVADQTELQQEIAAEHTQRRVLHFESHHHTASIHRPKDIPIMGATPATPVAAKTDAPATPVPKGLEHLESMERMLPQITDQFVRYGRLNTGDKDVLKKILPVDSSVNGRLTAVERWQAEVTRRARGFTVPRVQARVMLAGAAAQEVDVDQTYVHRFEAIAAWMSKLLKAYEHGGVKFQNKPMWLPH
jgi:hypothetical protein